MAMARIWVGMVALSVIFGVLNGQINEVGAAALNGAKAAVELCLSMAGVICLWTGVMEVMRQSGIAAGLSRILRPALKHIFPETASNNEAMEAISANVSANLLGLGNAATPLGIKAAGLIHNRFRKNYASDELCMFVIINSASLQLLPTTVAGVRAAAGAGTPFDIVPAVWFTSAVSLIAAYCAAKLFKRFRGGKL